MPPVVPHKIVAVATDTYLTKLHPFRDPSYLPGVILEFGNDFVFGTGRAAPKGHNVGSTVADLKTKMAKLLTVFASNDMSGMAARLFKQFLLKQTSVIIFDDPSLAKAAAGHANIRFFCNAALSAPNTPNRSVGKTRIHQALKKANWDVSKVTAPTDLGVPAFNDGTDWATTGDYGNGLGVMINGLQYAYVLATNYKYDKAKQKYDITLRYIFYDVFGLDDDDLDEKGAKAAGMGHTDAGIGITAWWQLQHQHNYAPLVTRIVLDQTFNNVPAT
jgi:hypothetical protein